LCSSSVLVYPALYNIKNSLGLAQKEEEKKKKKGGREGGGGGDVKEKGNKTKHET